MPLDTRNKRSSAIYVGSPWRGLLPTPDGAIGQANRQHVSLHYAGILAGISEPGERRLYQVSQRGKHKPIRLSHRITGDSEHKPVRTAHRITGDRTKKVRD